MIAFTKMHANGNDFMIIDNWHNTTRIFCPTQIRQWSDRNKGVGFDQLLSIEKSTDPHVLCACRIFNADGQEVGQCGHGLACVAEYLVSQYALFETTFYIKTSTGRWHVIYKEKNQVCVTLGVPTFLPMNIPFKSPTQKVLYPLNILSATKHSDKNFCKNLVNIRQYQLQQFTQFALEKISSETAMLFIQMLGLGGNPHCIVFVPNISHVPRKLGQMINDHTDFPSGTNIEYVQIINSDTIKIRVYERGVGETRACGSGACAAVIGSTLLGFFQPSTLINVQFPLEEEVQVHWDKYTQSVLLTTIVHHVFKGILCSQIV